MNANAADPEDRAAIRSTAAHLLSVTQAERGYRAVAPGLLHGLKRTIEAQLPASHPPGREGADPFLSAWGEYTRQWNGKRIAADWPGFAAATHQLLPRLLARIDTGPEPEVRHRGR